MYLAMLLLCLMPSTAICCEQDTQKTLKRTADDEVAVSSNARRKIEFTDEVKQNIHRYLLTGDFDAYFHLANSLDAEQRETLYYLDCDPSGYTCSPLHAAAYYNNCAVIEKLVSGEIFSVDEPNQVGYRPLHYAATRNCPAAIECLKRLDADMDAEDSSQGATPLHHAARPDLAKP